MTLKDHAPPLGLLAVACLAVAGPLLLGGVPAGPDALLQELDFAALLGQALSAWRLPSWNPYLLCGAPHLGAMSGGPLHPVHLLLAPLGPELAVGWASVVHLLVAAASCYALAFRLCRCPLGAMAAGGIYALGGYSVLHLEAGHVSLLGSYSLIPLAVLGADRLLARGGAGRLAVAALCLGLLVLSGHGQLIVIGLVAVTLFCGVRLFWWRPEDAIPRARAASLLLGAAAMGALLSAVQWLPAISFAARSGRGAVFDAGFYSIGQLSPADLALALAPGPVARAYDFPWETCGAVGVAGLTLALLALGRNRSSAALGGLVLLGVLLAVGPVYLSLVKVIPGLGMFRVPGRFLALATLFASLLAAMALARPAAGRLLTCAGVVGVLALAGGALLPEKASSWYWPAALVPAALVAALAWAARAERLSEQNLRRGLALLVLVELCVFAWPRVKAADQVPSMPPRIAAHLRKAGPDHRLLIMVPERYGRRPRLSLNMAVRARVPSIGGYVPAAPERMRRYFAMAAGHGPDVQMVRFFTHRLTPAVANLGLRFVLTPQGIRAPSFLRPVLSEGGLTLLELNRPWARARIIRKTARAWSAESAASRAVHHGDLDMRITAMQEGPLPPPVPGRAVPSAADGVRWIRADLGGMELQVTLKRPGLLKLADAYDEGWRASSNGKPVQVVPLDGVLMGLHLGAGVHRVKLTYEDEALASGLPATLAGMLTLIALAVVSRARKQQKEIEEKS